MMVTPSIRKVTEMLIPHDALPAETFQSLLEDFVTRDGTDNGYSASLEERVASLREKINRSEVFVSYNVAHDQCCLVPRHEVSAQDIRDWLSTSPAGVA